MKKAEFWNIYPEFLTKKKIRWINKACLSLEIKSTTLFIKISTNFSKIDEKLGKNFGKCEKNNVNSLYFFQKFKPR